MGTPPGVSVTITGQHKGGLCGDGGNLGLDGGGGYMTLHMAK